MSDFIGHIFSCGNELGINYSLIYHVSLNPARNIMIDMINVIERFRSSRRVVGRDLLYNENQFVLLKFEKRKAKIYPV